MWIECSFNAHLVPSANVCLVCESTLHIHSDVILEMGFVHNIRPYAMLNTTLLSSHCIVSSMVCSNDFLL